MNITTDLSPVLKNYLHNKFRGKKILILGLAREGLSTFKLLSQLDIEHLYLADHKPVEELSEEWQEILQNLDEKLDNKKVSYLRASELKEDFSGLADLDLDVVFKTPGLPKEKLASLNLNDQALTSNTRLFFELVDQLKKDFPNLTTIGVTGTKGKTTTTSLIHHVLKESGKQTYLGGNIGVPPLELVEEIVQADQTAQAGSKQKIYLVLEMSCHQLDKLPFSPDVAVIQGISKDHLDYYHDFERYCQAKSSIARYQNKGDVVLFYDRSKPSVELAGLSHGEKNGFDLESNLAEVELIQSSGFKLMGRHNIINALPAVLIAQKEDIPAQTIKSALASFNAVPHRLEFVREIDGIRFYNDSASSAPEATMAAIKAFGVGNEMVLIAGGSEKDVSFEKLAELILESPIKYLVLFPTTGEFIYQEIEKIDPEAEILHNSRLVSNMEEAVNLAYEQAQNFHAETVLLSPGSASFNMFKSFADRGDQFRELVKNL
jgi:UDP-N-acetylmuramoylalanine--D-glutamate ligase